MFSNSLSQNHRLPRCFIEKMSLNANQARRLDRHPTYRGLILRIFRLRDEISRRDELAASGQSNTEGFNNLCAGIDFETVAIEESIWDVRDDADQYMLIDIFRNMIGVIPRSARRA
jgi:hypothetical protein